MYSQWLALTNEEINANVGVNKAGNYLLGNVIGSVYVKVMYVGRSDTDLASRLKDHIDEGYGLFKFKYATSPKAAFEQECTDYHNYGGRLRLNNAIHPDSPSGISRKCPICGKMK